ncbi:hypothetical protein ABZ371_26550 [Streptomyces sp. NPDC005899]|uniref:hypothetical protein n=1 Tax=Streptomyces sp. NPDC005899 TaxID=3155716 RepID=UPI0033EEC903
MTSPLDGVPGSAWHPVPCYARRTKANDRALTEVVLRTYRRMGVDPLWLHRGHCEVAKLGAGLAPLTDWMATRRLDATILSDQGAAL